MIQKRTGKEKKGKHPIQKEKKVLKKKQKAGRKGSIAKGGKGHKFVVVVCCLLFLFAIFSMQYSQYRIEILGFKKYRYPQISSTGSINNTKRAEILDILNHQQYLNLYI